MICWRSASRFAIDRAKLSLMARGSALGLEEACCNDLSKRSKNETWFCALAVTASLMLSSSLYRVFLEDLGSFAILFVASLSLVTNSALDLANCAVWVASALFTFSNMASLWS